MHDKRGGKNFEESEKITPEGRGNLNITGGLGRIVKTPGQTLQGFKMSPSGPPGLRTTSKVMGK